MRGVGQGFLQHALHFFDFFHQVQLGGQASGGVGQYDVDAAGFCGFHGIETHGGGVAGGLGNHGNVVALAPLLQLLARGGAEGVARGQQHAFALGLEVFGQFADGGGFACAVHTGHHNHKRGFIFRGVVFRQRERFFQRFEQFVEAVFEGAAQFVGIAQAAQADAAAYVGQQVLGGFDAHVAGEQHGFQLFVEVFVDFAAAKHARQRFAHVVARFAQALLEACRPALFCRLGRFGCGRRIDGSGCGSGVYFKGLFFLRVVVGVVA